MMGSDVTDDENMMKRFMARPHLGHVKYSLLEGIIAVVIIFNSKSCLKNIDIKRWYFEHKSDNT